MNLYLVEFTYIYKNFFRAQRDFVLSLQTLELVLTKNNTSSYSIRLSFAGGIWVVKDKANYSDSKITKKVLKLTKLMTQI